MFDNLASKWSKEETQLLEKHLNNDDYEELCELFPGRTKAGIKAKQKRLIKSKESKMPEAIARGIFKYYLNEEAEGQILLRLRAAGHDYTLKDISVAVRDCKLLFSEQLKAYADQHNLTRKYKIPTLPQLKNFIEATKLGDEVALRKAVTHG